MVVAAKKLNRKTTTAQLPSELPLSMVPQGHKVNLVSIYGGQKLKKRLADLGMNVGMPIRVIQNPGFGPMILGIKRDARLALGRGMAHKIRVTISSDTRNPN